MRNPARGDAPGSGYRRIRLTGQGDGIGQGDRAPITPASSPRPGAPSGSGARRSRPARMSRRLPAEHQNWRGPRDANRPAARPPRSVGAHRGVDLGFENRPSRRLREGERPQGREMAAGCSATAGAVAAYTSSARRAIFWISRCTRRSTIGGRFSSSHSLSNGRIMSSTNCSRVRPESSAIDSSGGVL